MTLIKSISGIRGTIGGKPGLNLTPVDIIECTAAFGTWVIRTSGIKKIIVGRDGRISGKIVSELVINTLQSLGIEVIDLGLSTTPTVEIAVPLEKAGGGIILTASHNPAQWNALKFLNSDGEFISGEDGKIVLNLIDDGEISFSEVHALGAIKTNDTYINRHIQLILDLDVVFVEQIKKRKYKVVVDAINSTGAIAVPALLNALGCETILINGEINGEFAHNPEPLPEHLGQICAKMLEEKAEIGIVVDPDVDRLAFVCEDGSLFGEEYTLVAAADHILSLKPGNTVSNMSSTRALRDVTESAGGIYQAAAVGEVNVVKKMKEINAVIGGEGNGGVIYPQLHYGRDALVGIAIVLSKLASSGLSLSQLRAQYPNYFISKNKIELSDGIDMDELFKQIQMVYKEQPINTEDGLKIEFGKNWVHLRKSNTEPIIRIYAESNTAENADKLALDMISEIKKIGKL
ncbi:MAG: phosphoglucosamine mutase [Saprospiraceae bacterium]|nr:phosphoglucosamine mutase [Saprospiraceae bacterium]